MNPNERIGAIRPRKKAIGIWRIIIRKNSAVWICRIYGVQIQSLKKRLENIYFLRDSDIEKCQESLPGCPDIVLKKYRTVIFVNGCFWHHHDCGRFVWPSTNEEYWHKKIDRNVERDKEDQQALEELGWQVLVIWECQLKRKNALTNLQNLYEKIVKNPENRTKWVLFPGFFLLFINIGLFKFIFNSGKGFQDSFENYFGAAAGTAIPICLRTFSLPPSNT